MRKGTWLRVLRGYVAALAFMVLSPAPAAARPSADVVMLIAGVAAASAPALYRSATRLAMAPRAAAPLSAKARGAAPLPPPTRATGEPSARPKHASPPAPHERLYLVNCALLR